MPLSTLNYSGSIVLLLQQHLLILLPLITTLETIQLWTFCLDTSFSPCFCCCTRERESLTGWWRGNKHLKWSNIWQEWSYLSSCSHSHLSGSQIFRDSLSIKEQSAIFTGRTLKYLNSIYKRPFSTQSSMELHTKISLMLRYKDKKVPDGHFCPLRSHQWLFTLPKCNYFHVVVFSKTTGGWTFLFSFFSSSPFRGFISGQRTWRKSLRVCKTPMQHAIPIPCLSTFSVVGYKIPPCKQDRYVQM